MNEPSTPRDERRFEPEFISPDEKETQPNFRDVHISVWFSREVDPRPGAGARAMILSALVGLAWAAVVIFVVALLLISAPLVGVFSAVVMFGVVRHAQFRRFRTALARGKRI
ncbi:MAG: hypothetical protein FWC84_07240 [Alphaproteobacteria bacterium]|nr:hypothetical protein [Alphaproteobacteria bacterium]